MSSHPAPIAEWRDVSPSRFREEILPSAKPAVLRGLVSDWPMIRAARESDAAAIQHLRRFDNGGVADTMTAPHSIGGRFFYTDDLRGRNFVNERRPLAAALDRLLALKDDPAPPALYIGALPTQQFLPGFDQANPMPLLDPSVVSRIWLGNRVTVQTHFDPSFNVACVVAGRRKFTLFPPEQLANMYVGPLEFTLAGPPISMARVESPDFDKHPRFREALAHAQFAELGPGDAIFIPYMWWHHVESLELFNVLVNYWWDDMPPWLGSPFEVLLHGILAVRNLPPERREIWRRAFEHFVFSGGAEAIAHLPEAQRGIQGAPSQRIAQMVRGYISQMLAPRR